MKHIILIAMLSSATQSFADILVPVRTIRAKEVIGPQDLIQKPNDISGAMSDPATLIGQEARVVLYPGRPIRPGDVGAPALIGRNDLVPLRFVNGTLRITTEGRALGRGAVGESIKVMNLASRTTVVGRVQPDGSIEVQ